jgi:molecular chaperone GrpE (heat shock protein)
VSGRRIDVTRGDPDPEDDAKPSPEGGGGERSSSGSGWESLAEDSAGALSPSPELEEALREAAEAVEERGQARERQRGGAAGPSPREAELTAEVEATRDRYLRLHADFENFRRRASRERLEAEQYGHQNLVKDLLTAVDNLDRAIDHARRSDGGDLESLLQGVELVRRELVAALVKHGVTVPSIQLCTRRWRRRRTIRWPPTRSSRSCREATYCGIGCCARRA